MSVKDITAEWNDYLNSGRLPVMEFYLSNSEYIVVDLELKKHTMYFTFNSIGDKVYLDGLTKRYWLNDKDYIHAKVALKYFDSLQSVLEHIAADAHQHIIDNGLEIRLV